MSYLHNHYFPLFKFCTRRSANDDGKSNTLFYIESQITGPQSGAALGHIHNLGATRRRNECGDQINSSGTKKSILLSVPQLAGGLVFTGMRY